MNQNKLISLLEVTSVVDVTPVFEIHKKLLNFLASDTSRNEWLETSTFSIYVRKGLKVFDQETFTRTLDIASVTCNLPGEGLFTLLLQKIEEDLPSLNFKGIFIENVQNERFAEFFRKRKFSRSETIGIGGTPCFYKVL